MNMKNLILKKYIYTDPSLLNRYQDKPSFFYIDNK